VEANSTGGQGSRRAVAPSGGGGGGDDDDDDNEWLFKRVGLVMNLLKYDQNVPDTWDANNGYCDLFPHL
jgi:hypothetical protein